jgi:hypothetical protein
MDFVYSRKIIFILGISLILVAKANAQNALGQELNTITTAVPFLMIAPDARAAALGDAGVASTPDVNSMHWNPAKYAFIEGDMGLSASYSPWLRKIVPDIFLGYLSGFKKINNNEAVAMSLLYFSLGNVTQTNPVGQPVGTLNPNEFSLDATYSRKFSDKISGAVAARYIHSNLTQGQYVGSSATKAGNSVAADVSVYYQAPVTLQNGSGIFAWGVNISNIGAKVSYSNDNTRKEFIPTNLRLGSSYTVDFDEFNRMTFLLDLNKLLVPTPPIYNQATPPVIISGRDPNVSVPMGMLQSFYDAPNGFGEELREIGFSGGVEYWYNKQFAVRGGFFYEDKTKGNRKFFTLGAGLKYNVFGLDFSYLIPMEQHNPLENTLRFSLLIDFAAVQGKASKPQEEPSK